jgi:hypothetical protein
MCTGLAELLVVTEDYCSAFDPALLAGTDAAGVVRDAAAMKNMWATVEGLAASWVADTGVWRREGDRSAAHHLARATGTSVGQAVEAIETARRLESLPEVAAQARRGALSAAQSSLIASAAAADPAAQSDLLARAAKSSLAELREECARVRAAAESDPEARRARIHRGRYLRSYTDPDGAWNLRVRDNPEVGAEFMAALAPFTDRLFAEARAEGRREPVEAYAADALADMAAVATSAAEADTDGDVIGQPTGDADAATSDEATADTEGDAPQVTDQAADAASAAGKPAPGRPARRFRRAAARAKVIARVDLAVLLRGYPLAGETCELVGYGPVAVSAIRDMIDTGDPFLAAVATKGQDIVGVAHLGRRASAAQQTALEWLYPACAVLGCPTQVFLENDHREEWAKTHLTVFDWLDRLCAHHHELKTHHGWALVEGTGKRAFVPPDDPRHPGRRGARGP